MKDRCELTARLPGAGPPRSPRLATLLDLGAAFAAALVLMALRGPKLPASSAD
jgi:hypothetical protein